VRYHLCCAGLALATVLGAGAALPVYAGAQREEPLANSVRTALSAAIAKSVPPVPVFVDDRRKESYERWKRGTGERLKKRKPDDLVREEFLRTVWYEATRAGLDPTLVLGLIEVESGFRKYAISVAGARGYMQVMPFWSRTIGDGDAARLFHMQSNLRFGCVILRHYLDIEKGDLFLALGRYNGSRGRAEYPNAVLGARKRWEAAVAEAGPQVVAGVTSRSSGTQ
jgi:soluble lytic murein transglycosylase-like protein